MVPAITDEKVGVGVFPRGDEPEQMTFRLEGLDDLQLLTRSPVIAIDLKKTPRQFQTRDAPN